MLFQKPTVDFLIAGLGNPGKQYAGTRHNAGFDALDHAARRWGIAVDRAKFDGLCGLGTLGDCRVLLLKPQTFMNLSGQSVGKAADFYKIPPQRVIVLFDDISLPPGKLRLRKAGSAGGHNGVKDIIARIGQEFPRVKIGVGEKPRPEYDLADWVLGRMSADERKAMERRFDDVAGAVEMITKGQFEAAQSRYNG